jgi:glycosyltransferase involved in cell wall biosynthesis
MKLSLIIPIYNEAENIPLLYKKIREVVHGVYEYEIIAVNDGSKDASAIVLEAIAQIDKEK